MSDALRIARIEVRNLFGLYDHSFDLKMEDRVTILHGPNGVGKTVLLRLTQALFLGRYSSFWRIPFESFVVSLADDSVLSVQRNKKDHVRIQLSRDGVQLNEPFEPKKAVRKFSALVSRALPPWYVALNDVDAWRDERTGEIFHSEELLRLYGDRIPGRYREELPVEEPKWLTKLRANVKIYLIETDRLQIMSRIGERGVDEPREPRFIRSVRSDAQHLQRSIAKHIATYSDTSQSLDQTFPQRLLRESIEVVSDDSLKERMSKLDEKRDELRRIGLLADEKTDSFDIGSLKLDDAQRRTMTLYVRDTDEKLRVFDDLLHRIRLMLRTLNAKLYGKKIQVRRGQGIVAIGSDGEDLDLDVLSSGEQHELVLIYDLLFKMEKNAFVMIDEPELSLHLAWQKHVLSDFLQIAEEASLDILLATHSPDIVGDRDDLMVPLSFGKTCV